MAKTSDFTAWQIWTNAPLFDPDSFRETIDGGQAFRWIQQFDYYEGRWGAYHCRLRYGDKGVEYSVPPGLAPEILPALEAYFAVETPFDTITDTLPWRSDAVLARAIQAFPNLRILRQPFPETLFCFLCSSTKQIPQIKAICETVAQTIGSGSVAAGHALPSWNAIAAAGEAPLRAAKLGYRARYINESAQFLAERPGWLEEVEQLPTENARARLIELPGVGRKIADCTLLFGAGRLDAFPIDTWVEKILSRAYGLSGWKSEQLQQFARVHFGEAAGLAQQYLFAAARAGLIAR